jgi:hypothetical protein
MTIISEFFADPGLRGEVQTNILLDGYRYKLVHLRGSLVNRISSMRGYAAGGPGHIYAFTESHLLGKYVALNLSERHQAWISALDPAHDDTIDLALLVARFPRNEIAVDLGPAIRPAFAARFDELANGTEVRRSAEPLVFTYFWPGHDPHKIFVSLYQDMVVRDYRAHVRYDVELYLTAERRLDAFVKWTSTWVAGGWSSRALLDALHPRMVAGSYAVTEMLRDKLSLWHSFRWHDFYLLPGPRPSSLFGERRAATDGSTLVLAY